jgi:hypothetical protein
MKDLIPHEVTMLSSVLNSERAVKIYLLLRHLLNCVKLCLPTMNLLIEG